MKHGDIASIFFQNIERWERRLHLPHQWFGCCWRLFQDWST